MRTALLLACMIATLAASGADQPVETVEVQKTSSIPMPGATAAYSLNPEIVEASATDGVVQLHGISSGTTTVIVVEPIGTVSITVTVPQQRNANGRRGALFGPGGFDSSESGSYEARYSSDPREFTNLLELRRDEGESFWRLQVVNANYFSTDSGVSPVAFPLLSYEFGNARRDVVFLDAAVRNSPLTVNGPFVRGFHLRQGNWDFHAGFTSLATFQNYFLATTPEYVAGISRRFQLSTHGMLSANFYYFLNSAKETAISRNGAAGSLLYTYKPRRRLSVLAELGMSHAPGAAGEIDYGNLTTHVSATVRYRPSGYAALAIDNQHGLFADVDFSRRLSNSLMLIGHLNESDFRLPVYRQNTLTASSNLTYKPFSHVAISTGVLYSNFNAAFPAPFHLQTTSGILGVDFYTKHFNAGGQYEPSVDSTGQLASGYSGNLSTRFGKFQTSASYRHAVQIPTLATLFSAVPGLQNALERSGVFISDPQQLQQFLTNTAVLQTLGFTSGLNLNFAPARNDTSLNTEWSRTANERLSASFIDSKTQLVSSSFHFRTGTVSYTRHIGFNNELSASVSAFQTIAGGTSAISPVVQLSFRHRFGSVPAALLGGRHGTIQGHVFHDDDITRHYAEAESGIAGVEVRLDDRTSTRTDSEGYYVFRRVPYGIHTIQAKVTDPRPYFFTTDSPASTPIDAIVDIGVSFVRGKLFGRIQNDAGSGVPGVELILTGPNLSRHIQAAFDGKFSMDGVPDGEYTISTVPESYPDGYNLIELPLAVVTVKPDRPNPVTLVAKAFRTVLGRVTVLTPNTTQTQPVEAAAVTIVELGRTVKTDKAGKFLFRNLPSGNYTVSAMYEGKMFPKSLELPPTPVIMTNFDILVK